MFRIRFAGRAIFSFAAVLSLLVPLCCVPQAFADDKVQLQSAAGHLPQEAELRKSLHELSIEVFLPELKHRVPGPHQLLLYRYDGLFCIGNSSVGPDGPVSVAEPIDKARAIAFIDFLAGRGLLKSAPRYYSPRTDKPAGAPPGGAKDYAKSLPPKGQILLTHVLGDWHVYYDIVVRKEALPELLRACSAAVGGKPGKLLVEFADKSEVPDADQATYETTVWFRKLQRSLDTKPEDGK